MEAIENYRAGYTIENSCGAAGICSGTFHEHRRKNPEIESAFNAACDFRFEISKRELKSTIEATMVQVCRIREKKKVTVREIRQGDTVVSTETETEISTVDPHPRVLEYYSGVVGIIPTATASNDRAAQEVYIHMLPASSNIETGTEKKEEGDDGN
jgi:hypothetical protein